MCGLIMILFVPTFKHSSYAWFTVYSGVKTHTNVRGYDIRIGIIISIIIVFTYVNMCCTYII